MTKEELLKRLNGHSGGFILGKEDKSKCGQYIGRPGMTEEEIQAAIIELREEKAKLWGCSATPTYPPYK